MSQVGRYDALNGVSPIETLTGNVGGPVGPTAGNIDVVGTGDITVTGNPGTSTLTISFTGTLDLTFHTDAGDATSVGGEINVLGGTNINTAGAADTVTVNLDSDIVVDSVTTPVIASTAGLTIDAVNNLDINSSTGDINIGDDAVAQNINIGTGAAAKTVTVGNVTGATSLMMSSGTGGITMSSTGTGDITINSDDTLLLDSDGVLELNASAGAISIGNDANAFAINVGTGAAPRTITIGNTNTSTGLRIRSGTNDMTYASATGTIINARDTGEISYPLQPAFLGVQNGNALNVTGASVNYTLGTTTAFTEVYDQNNDFNTNGTFTAPVTGRYFLEFGVLFQGLDGDETNWDLRIITSNGTYRQWQLNPGSGIDASGSLGAGFSICADMDALDTATVIVQIIGGVQDVDVIGPGGTDRRTIFSGYLIA